MCQDMCQDVFGGPHLLHGQELPSLPQRLAVQIFVQPELVVRVPLHRQSPHGVNHESESDLDSRDERVRSGACARSVVARLRIELGFWRTCVRMGVVEGGQVPENGDRFIPIASSPIEYPGRAWKSRPCKVAPSWRRIGERVRPLSSHTTPS
eukprot:8190342-Pyramimonas_sp.AAC.1